jgi:hypothetical protein
MERFSAAVATFEHALDRSRQMVTLFDALSALRPREAANDDALRSAYILAVSSLDFLAHELAAVEANHRFSSNLLTRNIQLPMDVITSAEFETRVAAAENHIRQANSYKAFVDPAKLAELLSCYCHKPWEKLAALINSGLPENEKKSCDHIKGQLKSVWKRRNQIAHEADINPTLGGVSLWPIDKADTELTINFIGSIGAQLPKVFSEILSGDDNDQ